MRRLFFSGLALLAACSAAPADDDGAIASEADLTDARFIGTFRNDAAKRGELRTLSLEGDGSAAIVVQECTTTSCSSVESVGTYDLGRRGADGERRLDLTVSGKKLAFRSRLNASSFTIDAQSIALLELDATTGAPKSPIVTFTLDRSDEVWCATTNDCNMQAVRAEKGPAIDCVARMCSWEPSAVCTPNAASDPLVTEPLLAGAPSGRMSAAGAWVGDRMFVFGGRSSDSVLLADGGTYDPAAKSWAALGTTGAPSPREHAHAGGVAGKAVVVGGWLAGFADAKDAFLYDVATKAWSPIAVPAAVASDWHDEVIGIGAAFYRPGTAHLLHRIDAASRAVTTVADPPELAELVAAAGPLDPFREMVVATPSSVIVLAPFGGNVPSYENHTWRLFEYTPASSSWSVSDVGLGPIDTPTTITYAAGSLVLLSGESPRTGGSGIVAVVDLASKKTHVTSIGGGAAPSSAGWLTGYGGATGSPAFVIDVAGGALFDTLDVARARWVHRNPWGSPPARPHLAGDRSADVRVWTGTELLVWGGLEHQRVNGFDVSTFPQHIVRYSPARCTP